uniref:Uncharacterized protein n=1 Tax=Mus spicilegus TaxID=10103 RepID=A0A8C6GFZ4_MUSSI
MMTEVPTRFRELSVCNQAEGFLSPAGRGDFCVKLLLSNLSDRLEAKFWLVPGKLAYLVFVFKNKFIFGKNVRRP